MVAYFENVFFQDHRQTYVACDELVAFFYMTYCVFFILWHIAIPLKQAEKIFAHQILEIPYSV